MAWQNNLINNLIVFFVLGSLALVAYLKVAKKTIPELIKDIRGATESE